MTRMGRNRVTVVAMLPDGQQEETILSLVYSTVDLNAATSTNSATTQGEDNEN